MGNLLLNRTILLYYSENAKVIMLNLLALATGQKYEDLEERFQKAQQ